jgi:hypothetical protein
MIICGFRAGACGAAMVVPQSDGRTSGYYSMIRKSGYWFSEQIMLESKSLGGSLI